MVQSLQKLREPAVVVLLVALVTRLVVAALAFSGVLPGTDGSRRQAAGLATISVTDSLTVVVLVLLVGSCLVRPPTRHAGTLARVALGVVAAGVLGYVGAGIAWLSAESVPGRGYQVVQLLLGLVLPLLGLLALVSMSRPRGPAVGDERRSLESAPAEEPPALAPPRPDPESEPTWQPDEASGAVWLTAGDAASGAAASTWGTPGQAGGWDSGSAAPTRPAPATEPELDERPRPR